MMDIRSHFFHLIRNSRSNPFNVKHHLSKRKKNLYFTAWKHPPPKKNTQKNSRGQIVWKSWPPKKMAKLHRQYVCCFNQCLVSLAVSTTFGKSLGEDSPAWDGDAVGGCPRNTYPKLREGKKDCTPWKFNSSPLKIYRAPKRKVVFQTSFFRSYLKLQECKGMVSIFLLNYFLFVFHVFIIFWKLHPH